MVIRLHENPLKGLPVPPLGGFRQTLLIGKTRAIQGVEGQTLMIDV